MCVCCSLRGVVGKVVVVVELAVMMAMAVVVGPELHTHYQHTHCSLLTDSSRWESDSVGIVDPRSEGATTHWQAAGRD